MLQIARAQKEDAGRYKCQAVNEAGEDHMHFELEILSESLHMWRNSHFRANDIWSFLIHGSFSSLQSLR